MEIYEIYKIYVIAARLWYESRLYALFQVWLLIDAATTS